MKSSLPLELIYGRESYKKTHRRQNIEAQAGFLCHAQITNP